MNLKAPIKLMPARAWRTYLGGKLIDELHGKTDTADSNFPEEWLMSTVTARNVGREDIIEGLSETEDGVTLKEIVEQDPVTVLGAGHVAAHGPVMGVLVKLLDAMERLAVQVHPTKETARRLFESEYGKTECWHIIGCREGLEEPACIYMGFKEGVTREEWKRHFDAQDIPAMLNCLHRFQVQPGETYLICGGVPHAIGAGCLLVEIQEPTDYTIRTERVTVSGRVVADMACHQGLGFDRMFDVFEYNGLSAEETCRRWKLEGTTERVDGTVIREAVGYGDTPMFRLLNMEIKTAYTVEKTDVFSGIYVLQGTGTVDGKPVCAGDQYFLPASCESFEIRNNGDVPLRVVRYFGPKS